MTTINFWRLAKIGILCFSFLLLYSSCKEENLPPEIPPSNNEYISGTTVRYTILVALGGNSSFKSANMLDTTFVSLVMNDSIYNSVADENGMVTFNNLATGTIAVNIRRNNYTTINLLVDLTKRKDTDYDSGNLRNAATMVVLLPTNEVGTATISGRTFADLDLTIAGLEIAPAGLQISAIIEPSQLVNYVNHSGDGEILSLSYSPSVKQAISNFSSDYTVSVPATGSGLKIIIKANDFQYNQTVGVGTLLRRIYFSEPDTILAISGINYFVDIDYN